MTSRNTHLKIIRFPRALDSSETLWRARAEGRIRDGRAPHTPLSTRCASIVCGALVVAVAIPRPLRVRVSVIAGTDGDGGTLDEREPPAERWLRERETAARVSEREATRVRRRILACVDARRPKTLDGRARPPRVSARRRCTRHVRRRPRARQPLGAFRVVVAVGVSIVLEVVLDLARRGVDKVRRCRARHIFE
jgi:hypothetical protein